MEAFLNFVLNKFYDHRVLFHSQSTQQQTVVENFFPGVLGFSLEYLLCDVLSLE